MEDNLIARLSQDPINWDDRLALAECYFARGAHEQVAQLLVEAPNPPASQNQMHRAVELTAGGDLSGLNQVLHNYTQTNPSDAWAYHVFARILVHQHRIDEAKVAYENALALDANKKDPELEVLLRSPDVAVEEKLQVDPETPPAEFVGKTFMVALGDAVKPKEKESDDREKIRALITAVVIHVVMFISFYWVVVSVAPDLPPLIEAVSVHSLDEDSLSKNRAKVKESVVQESADSRVAVNLDTISSITAPEMNAQIESFAPVGMGGFGQSMSFSKGAGGGTVSFFGSKTKARRVVFVVDFSASMIGSKEKLMRQELSKSVKGLPDSVEFALIFFSGPAWYAGQKVGKAARLGKWVGNTVTDRNNKYIWYEGWDEKGRHSGANKTALYHFSDGVERLPKGKYKRANALNIRNSLETIAETPLVFGTDWRWPLMMAMNMQPDVIYFMTDGAFGVGGGVTKKQMINNLLTYNKSHSKAKINTICMQVLTARGELEQLSNGSGGDFTLIKSDGTVIRGVDLK